MTEPLSSSMEDYLEVIYELAGDGRGVRVKQIADHLGVSLPSVTSALRTLSDAGLVTHERYRPVELTPSGRARADALVNRHDALVRFLTEILLVDLETAEGEACRMEHAIGPVTLQRLVNFLQAVQRCPRGNAEWLNRLHARWRGQTCEEPCEPCVLVLEPPLEGFPPRTAMARSRVRGLMPLSKAWGRAAVCPCGTCAAEAPADGASPTWASARACRWKSRKWRRWAIPSTSRFTGTHLPTEG